MNIARQITISLFFIVLAVLILLPLGYLIVASFTSAPPGVVSDYTLANYVRVYTDPSYYYMLINSLIIGFGAAAFAVIAGTSLAWIVARTDTPMTKTLEVAIVAPLIVSPFVGAIGWTFLLSPRVGLINLFLMSLLRLPEAPFNVFSYFGLIWILGLYMTPYIFLFVSSSLKSMDPSLEEASYVLGGGHLLTALRVTLPLNLPAIISGSILVFVISIEMFSVPAVIGMPAGIFVMTTQIYNYLSYFPPQYGAATVTGLLLLVITMISVYSQRRIMARRVFYTITGKGYRPRLVELGKLKFLTLGFGLVYTFFAVVLPILALVITSLLRYFHADFTLDELTLWNYQFALFEYPKTIASIRNTLFLAILGATIGILFTLAISYIVHRTKGRGLGALDYLATVPIGIPAIVLALALLWTWVSLPIGIYGTIWILLIAYITRYIPWGTRTTSSSLVQIHTELEECSTVLGASTLRRFRTIIIPLAKYGLISGWVLLFILFSRELSASILLYSPGTSVISVAMYELWENGDYGPLTALTVVQLIIVVVPLLIVNKLGGRVSLG